MEEPVEPRLREFAETRSYESLLWAARAALALPAIAILLPLIYAVFPEPVPVTGVVAILAVNGLVALLAAVHGVRGLLSLQRKGRLGWRATLKAVAPLIKSDLLDFSR